ncbi:MAG: cytochrome c-type biogenesis CcmF C-terminal domain-containing protein [Polyangia bacterium]
MAFFGQLMLCVTAVLSAAGTAVYVARGEQRRYHRVGRDLLLGAAASSAAVLIALLFLLVTRDYRVAYVHDYADRTMSLEYLIAALWGGHAGSLTLWAALQTWFTAAAAVWIGRRPSLDTAPTALGVLGGLGTFFALIVLFRSDPFVSLGTTATEGVGINPLLRNPYMTFHPPTLYLGFVGFSVPAAFAVAAMVHRRYDEAWSGAQRHWILTCWIFLTVGNVLGMVWAYEELGWGGYWGWDPVENASLMPWLTATALLHSTAAEERRGALRRWNVLLVCLTYSLVVFGTFLTRSGVIDSVHAFAGSSTGPWLLGLIAVSTVVPLVLLVVRWRDLAPRRPLGKLTSRDGMILLADVAFVVATVLVWVGTMMPLLAEVATGEKITLTPEAFNRWMTPVGLAVLALLALCVALYRRSKEGGDRFWPLAVPLVVGAASALIAATCGGFGSGLQGAMAVAPVAAVGLIGAGAAAVAQELRRIFVRRNRAEGSGGGSRRAAGAQIVHLGVLVAFAGFTGSAFTIESGGALGPGETLFAGDYRIHMIGLRVDDDVEREAIFADLYVRGPEHNLGVMSPARYTYHSHPGQPTSEVVIDSSAAGDLFLALGEIDAANGRAVIRAVVNPLVPWIWAGGLLVVLGTLLGMVRRGALARLIELDRSLRSRLLPPAGGVVLVVAAAGVAGALRGAPAAIVVLGAMAISLVAYLVASAAGGLAGSRGEGR